VYQLADSVDHAQRQAFSNSGTAALSATTADVAPESSEEDALSSNCTSAATIRSRSLCLYCGDKPHSRRSQCPARHSNCYTCGKRGCYSRVCRSATLRESTDGPNRSKMAATTGSRSLLASAPSGLESAIGKGSLEGNPVHVLIDSGASKNFVDTDIVRKLGLPIAGRATSIGMASSEVPMQKHGRVSGVLNLMDRQYRNVSFHVMPKLCADVIVGQEFLKRHASITFVMNGPEESLNYKYANDCVPYMTVCRCCKAGSTLAFRIPVTQCQACGFQVFDVIIKKTKHSSKLKSAVCLPPMSLKPQGCRGGLRSLSSKKKQKVGHRLFFYR